MSLDLFYDDVVIVSQMLYGISYNGAITGEGFRIIPWQKFRAIKALFLFPGFVWKTKGKSQTVSASTDDLWTDN